MSALRSQSPSAYQDLDEQYSQSGFTYKSNEILHKTAQKNMRHYPYDMLLLVSKIFHLNQFEIIFLSHILNDVEPCYNSEPDLFNEDIEIPGQVEEVIKRVMDDQQSQRYSQVEQFNIILKSSGGDVKREEEEMREASCFSLRELKRIYSYLLVVGYAVKYYLNDQAVIRPYDEEIKTRHPTFFASIFNKWAKKYGNSALATTPRRINSYYLALASQLQVEDNLSNSNNEQTCQYRNYNEIVEELIKATTEGEEYPEVEKEGNGDV